MRPTSTQFSRTHSGLAVTQVHSFSAGLINKTKLCSDMLTDLDANGDEENGNITSKGTEL